MTPWKIAIRSLFHFWRNNLAIALGAAIATAVLTGALLVGDSMRSSLRGLVLDQLGKVDTLLVSDGFFRTALVTEGDGSPADGSPTDGSPTEGNATANDGPAASPLILFPSGTVQRRRDEQTVRAANVNVLGISDSFWAFDTDGEGPTLAGDNVVINRSLADLLGIEQLEQGMTLTLRIPKPTQLPAESALGVTDDLIESLVDLEIAKIVPDEGLGRFSLRPSQVTGPNLFISIQRLQESLARTTLKNRSTGDLCNAGFYSTAQHLESLRPQLEDVGLALKRVTQANPKQPDQPVFDYWSLSSEKLVFSPAIRAAVAGALPDAKEVITYLANDIRKSGEESGVPFSMVTAIDFDQDFQLMSINDSPILPLADNQIVLNEWAANDLGVAPGDPVEVEYFLPETTHGNQETAKAILKVAAIAKLTQPDRPFQVRRGNQIVAAVFDVRPTLANDPDLTPSVPGVTDADSIENWELPFSTAGKIRPQDDDYWNEYRTTPKAFVSLASGRRLFNSRFGVTTSFRVPVAAGDAAAIEQKLLAAFEKEKTDLGMRMIPIRQNSLTAAGGSTPFDVLFLALSMFVILSALILVSLLFRLAVQGRIAEVGLLQAVGLNSKQVAGVWLREMVIVCALGSILGVVIGVSYGALMIHGLTTWWVGAISTPFLKLSISPLSLAIGLLSGTLICWATIGWTLRQTRQQSVRQLLAGQIESGDDAKAARPPGRWNGIISALLMLVAIGLLVVAFGLSGDAKSGAFMGAGFLVLAAGLLMVYRRLKTQQTIDQGSQGSLDLKKLALLSARRNPLRSVLTISLISVASFLIIAVSSFRLSPTERGTGGFDYVATSSRPVFADLNTAAGQEELLGDERLDPKLKTIAMRLKPGQDASCNNLFQATQPRVIGVPQGMVAHFDDRQHSFEWAGAARVSDVGDEGGVDNPWRLLAGDRQRSDDDPIPVIIDKNTANYSLKIFALGTIYEVHFDSGETVKFEVVGFLSNTILQGSLFIGEADFKRAFPAVAGYRYFLIDAGDAESPDQQVAILEKGLGDQGFDARGAVGMLKNFMAVQNTYLSTFQSLGGLGLLLGTLGLAVVQIRSVIERSRELGLLRAVGFGSGRIANLIFWETGWLLAIGLGIGIFAALFATVPHFLFGNGSVPWGELIVIFVVIILTGVIASYLASRTVSSRPILTSLRD